MSLQNSDNKLTSEKMLSALRALDAKLSQSVSLIVGGGGAMLLAYQFPLSTSDIDAIPKGIEIAELDPLIKEVADELKIAPDWLNPYFSTFAYSLPGSYSQRLKSIFEGKNLRASALGMEDLLVMKCFAHRPKDVGHARALIRQGANQDFVFDHISELEKKGIPNSKEALGFLEEIIDQIED